MTTEDFRQLLLEILVEAGENFDEIDGSTVTPFSEAGLLTRDEGLVVTLDDGTEFQVTIVESTR